MPAMLTVEEAYGAMYRYLQRLLERTGSREIAGLLGEMSLLEDGTTVDPAAWSDWLEAVRDVQEKKVDMELGLMKRD